MIQPRLPFPGLSCCSFCILDPNTAPKAICHKRRKDARETHGRGILLLGIPERSWILTALGIVGWEGTVLRNPGQT